ncbi:MAG TPA: UMP kinase [Candidatus Methanomethylophilaceae archaeon]|nr:UMP kinase [Candidatus Methanomethylophilaceae archaeon]
MEKIVLSIGGSVLIPGEEDPTYLKQLAELLRSAAPGRCLFVVCGGGRISRYYSETGRALGGTVEQLDQLGIMITRVNAALLRIALGDAASKDAPDTVEQAAALAQEGKIVVMGGTVPGHTTDAVAAMLAREIGADRLVNATSVDAVYSDDPKVNPAAKRHKELSIEELGGLVYSQHDAGRSSVFDPMGVRIAAEEGIDILIVSGRDLEDLEAAILGKEIKGTTVHS